jgi:zinc protease
MRNAIFLRFYFALITIFLGGQPLSSHAQPLGIDPQVLSGTLANGLRYFIRPTEAAGIDVRLVVNTGSLDERNEELGYAHFVEHLAFRKTQNFADGEIINFVRSIGGSFGQHVNATTSYNATQYFISIPDSKQTALPNVLKIMRDWAFSMQFTDEIVNIERGVVAAERRSRDQSTQPIFKIRQTLYDQDLYRREIIGTAQSIAQASAVGLAAFYQRTYTPERMSIVIAGKFSEHPSALRQRIEQEFSQSPQVVPIAQVLPKFQFSPRVRLLQLPEAARPGLSIVSLMPDKPGLTKEDFKLWVIRTLATATLNLRIRELPKTHKWIVSQAAIDFGITQDARGFELALNLNDGEHYEQAYAVLRNTLERFVQDGPTDEELSATKLPMLRAARTSEQESSKLSPSAISQILGIYAQSGGFYLSSAKYKELLEEVIPTISANQIVTDIAQRFTTGDVIVIAQNQRGQKLSALNDVDISQQTRELLSKIKSAAETTLALSQPSALRSPKVDLIQPSAPGHILDEEQLPDQITRLTLSNRAIVYVKPLAATVDQVVMSMRRSGGLWSLPAELIPAARLAQAGAWLTGGIGAMTQQALSTALAEKNLNMNFSLSNNSVGVGLRARSEDLPLALNLVHQFLKQPKLDQENIERLKNQIRPGLLNSNLRPEQIHQRDWLSARRGPSLWLENINVDQLDSINTEHLSTLHNRSFGDASQMVFVFSGNVVLRDIRRLCETYIANLPSTNQSLQPVPWVKLPPEKNGTRLETRAGKADRVAITVLYANTQAPDSLAMGALSSQLASILNNRLRLALRQESGLSYSPNATVQSIAEPFQGMFINIQATINPADTDKVESVIRETVQSLITKTPTDEELKAFREAYSAGSSAMLVEPASTAELLLTLHQRKISFGELIQLRRQVLAQDADFIATEFKKLLAGIVPSVGIHRAE